GGRLAPVDDATARRLLRALNIVIVLPLAARTILQVMPILYASPAVTAAAAAIYVPFISAALVYSVWHWRRDMAAWFEGLVQPKDLFRAGKISLAQNWWLGGLVFYISSGLLAVHAALNEQGLANAGLAAMESLLFLLL